MTPDVATLPPRAARATDFAPVLPKQPTDRSSILVVDDDDDTRAMLTYMLTSAGLAVLEARDGATALHLARTESIFAVVLDIVLPDRNGYDVCRELRDTVDREIPIVMVSALSPIMSDGSWVRAGGNAYLAKPLRRAVLIAHLLP
jgi:DNA-binding response OmpR family regulator